MNWYARALKFCFNVTKGSLDSALLDKHKKYTCRQTINVPKVWSILEVIISLLCVYYASLVLRAARMVWYLWVQGEPLLVLEEAGLTLWWKRQQVLLQKSYRQTKWSQIILWYNVIIRLSSRIKPYLNSSGLSISRMRTSELVWI